MLRRQSSVSGAKGASHTPAAPGPVQKHVRESTERCWKAFNELDVDRSGCIREENLLQALKKMGPLSNVVSMMPGMSHIKEKDIDPKATVRVVAIIDSMTPLERRKPEVINGSRKRRVAQGSGTQIQDVNRLLKQHKQMQRMMKKMGSKGGMKNMMRGMKGRLPPGMPF